MTGKEVIEFGQLRKQRRDPFNTGEIMRIDEVLNKEIVIEDFTIDKGANFDMTYILAYVDGKKVTITTTSKVISRQLTQIENVLRGGAKVKARVTKRKRYYALE